MASAPQLEQLRFLPELMLRGEEGGVERMAQRSPSRADATRQAAPSTQGRG
jgi:hypothetical protein